MDNIYLVSNGSDWDEVIIKNYYATNEQEIKNILIAHFEDYYCSNLISIKVDFEKLEVRTTSVSKEYGEVLEVFKLIRLRKATFTEEICK